jgi:hypothetical protein
MNIDTVEYRGVEIVVLWSPTHCDQIGDGITIHKMYIQEEDVTDLLQEQNQAIEGLVWDKMV